MEGHQSQKYPTTTLDKWAVLNKEMDSLAKAYLLFSEQYEPLNEEVDPREWSVYIQGHKICTNLRGKLGTYLRAQPIVASWTSPQKQGGICRAPKYTKEQINSLDSDNAQIAWKST